MRVIYFYFTTLLLLVFLSYLFIDPNFHPLRGIYSGFAFSHKALVSYTYVSLVVVSFMLYLRILKMFKNKKLNKAQAIGIISGSVVVLFFSYPAMLSYDIFNYLTTAKVLYHYGENPYLVMPIEFTRDQNLLFTHAANKFALYGPSWIGITSVPYLLGFGNTILEILGFKFLNVLFYALSLFLILRISKDYYRVLFFGLNPLVLIETLLSGHNDIVMMFFALLAFYFIKERRSAFSLLFIVVSILIKYATVFLLPLYAYLEYLNLRKRNINWDKIFTSASCSMMLVFFLSFIREEIYPWYAIWFFIFASLTHKKFLRGLSLVLTLFLLFRYVPFMYTGSHFGSTPIIKTVIIIVPAVVYVFYYFARLKNMLGKW